jgi:hypothetical protein
MRELDENRVVLAEVRGLRRMAAEETDVQDEEVIKL